jgi:hypothetical protein
VNDEDEDDVDDDDDEEEEEKEMDGTKNGVGGDVTGGRDEIGGVALYSMNVGCCLLVFLCPGGPSGITSFSSSSLLITLESNNKEVELVIYIHVMICF